MAGLRFIRQYVESMTDEDVSVNDFAKIIRQFGLVGGAASPRLGQMSLYEWLNTAGAGTSLTRDILDQVRQDAQAMFRSGATLDDIFESFGLNTDGIVDDAGVNQIIRLLHDGAILPDILGSSYEYLNPSFFLDDDEDELSQDEIDFMPEKEFDEWMKSQLEKEDELSGDDEDARMRSLDPEKISFIPYEQYLAGKKISDSSRYERMFVEAYLDTLTDAYFGLIRSGNPSLTIAEGDDPLDVQPTMELRNAYMNAVRKTLVSLARLNGDELKSAQDFVANLTTDAGKEVFDQIMSDTSGTKAEAMFSFLMTYINRGIESSESPIEFMESLVGLDRSQLVDTLRNGFFPGNITSVTENYGSRASEMFGETIIDRARDVLPQLLQSDFTIEEIARIADLPESQVADLIKERKRYEKAIDFLEKTGIWTDAPSRKVFKSLIDSGYSVQDIAVLFNEDLDMMNAIIDSVKRWYDAMGKE
jgi:predicted DNA-binding protein YlxM (UPF0122 family)